MLVFAPTPEDAPFFLALMLFAGEIAVIVFFIRAFRHNRHFETRGRLLQGQIVEARGCWVMGRDASVRTRDIHVFEITVRYIFRTPDQHQRTDTSTHRRDDLSDSTMPEAGTPVAILYIDEKTYMLL